MKTNKKYGKYTEKIKELFEEDQYNPSKKIISKKYKLLKESIEHFYNICEKEFFSGRYFMYSKRTA